MADIKTVGVVGAGTMGGGIAALCADRGLDVVLLDVDRAFAERAVATMTEGRAPLLDDPAAAARIRVGSIADDLHELKACDWICEAIIEDLGAKRDLMTKVEAVRADGSLVTSNTSGILLQSIVDGMPARLRRDVAVTHFFNPVKVMKLVELVPGDETTSDAMTRLATFLKGTLDKGVVYGKDTVNFVANRVGCFWMLAGLHKAEAGRADGLDQETIDALLGVAPGVPGTGLYGLIDLIGLDVMGHVARNLASTLPERDPGLVFASLPPAEQAMLARGQLGRKTSGGFYRVTKAADGSRLRETFDLGTETWRPTSKPSVSEQHGDPATLLFADDPAGHYTWDLLSDTLAYAADLVPEIADDIVNVDRALRWGFNWTYGPFELLDKTGPARVIDRLEQEKRPVPAMLRTLRDAGQSSFYKDNTFLTVDGRYEAIPD